MAKDSKFFIEDGVMHIEFFGRPKTPVVLKVDDVTCHKCRMIATLGEGRLCEFCRRPAAVERRSILDRLFPDRWFSTQVIVVSIVLIAIFVTVYNVWN